MYVQETFEVFLALHSGGTNVLQFHISQENFVSSYHSQYQLGYSVFVEQTTSLFRVSVIAIRVLNARLSYKQYVVFSTGYNSGEWVTNKNVEHII